MTEQHRQAGRIWDDFCQRLGVVDRLVPLFQLARTGEVLTHTVGSNRRVLLRRSSEMEVLLRTEARRAVEDYESGWRAIDGLIYMMGWRESNRFVPLYVGKAETLGRGNGNLSVNLKNLDRDSSKFARWGDGYSYHIGDLSACVLPGHPNKHQHDKYRDWASTLFTKLLTDRPVLTKPVWFWASAWENTRPGIWEELGPTRLAFLEYTMIGVASMVSPHLLNREGRQRL
jgi:hypothetical protein